MGHGAWAFSLAGFLALVATSFIDLRKAKAQDNSVEPMEGAVEILWQLLVREDPACDPKGLRVCVHYFVGENQLEQLTNYVSANTIHRSGKGRQFSTEFGVTGAALEKWKVAVEKLPAGKDVVTYLMETYRIKREQAEDFCQDRKSWAAMPIGEQNRQLGVIFCDSSETDFFGNKGSRRRKILQSSAVGVAEFIARRYNPKP